jgi:hypothetical protein
MRIVLIACLALAGSASAEPALGTFEELQRALPAGWTLKHEGTLVISRTQMVRIAGRHHQNAHYSNIPVVAPPNSAPITLELRFKLETRWTAKQLADAKAANAAVAASLASLRTKHRIDDIKTSKGRPLPSTPDEQQRLADYEAEAAKVRALAVTLPRCTIGGMSLFDDDHTTLTLARLVDPPIAMREAYAIVELIKRRCR